MNNTSAAKNIAEEIRAGGSQLEEGTDILTEGGREVLSRDAATRLTDDFVSQYTGRYSKSPGVGMSQRVAANRLRTGLFKSRQANNEMLRRLMGEVKDPIEALTTTVSDMAEFVATDRFYKFINQNLVDDPSGMFISKDAFNRLPKAVQDGDKWIINGQKVWTSGAHFSDFGILVVRHDPNLEKHKGMTFFFVDMKSPGIEVKPIKQITGGSSFNEVYFTDVEIPDSQRLGEIGDGWKVAITTLMNERLAVGDAGGADVEDAFRWAKTQDSLGEPLLNNKAARESIADWYCEKSGLKNTKLRTMSALSRGDTPGPEASITKIVSAGKLQDIGNFGIDSLDMAGMLKTDNHDIKGFQNAWLGAPGMRIAGGTDEILRNIIAERVLGLPQDPRADKGVAFKDIPSGNS